MFKFSRTNRGFSILSFRDHYENPCSIQTSSTSYEAIWIGVNDAKPQILASKAKELGVETSETTGWVPYHVPDDVSLYTRMYLTREQAGQLAIVLKKYAKTGKLHEIPKTKRNIFYRLLGYLRAGQRALWKKVELLVH